MKAMVFYGPGDLRFEEFPTPHPGPGEVVVRIGAALTCGTDLKTFHRGHPVMIPTLPSVFGHELAGTVAAVGQGVREFKLGDRVVAANSAPCGSCDFCRMDRHNLCEALCWLNGAYAEAILVPEPVVRQNLLKLPAHLTFRQAAFVEPLACALNGVDTSGLEAGQTCAIIGDGPAGLLLLLAVRARGARCLVVGRHADRLKIAGMLGAETLEVSNGEDPVVAIQSRTPNGRGADVVIEAIGHPAVWEQAVRAVRKGGTVVFFGGCEPGTWFSADTRRVHYEELTLRGAFHHTPRLIRRALQALSSGEIDPMPLVTHTMPLGQLRQALELVARREALKVAIIPS